MLRRIEHSAMVLAAAAVLLAAAGCAEQKMYEQPRYEEYELSTFFLDSMSARPIPEGTVSRSSPRLFTDYFVGTNPYYTEEGEYVAPGEAPVPYEQRLVTAFPFEVTMPVLERGQQQFNIYCSPCHGRLGNGAGMIVQRGFRQPPSFHTERLRNAPVGHFFNVITNGYGAMYSYAARVEPADRWAVVAYIRALQLSQHAPLEAVPEDRLDEMQVIRPAAEMP